MKCPICNQKFNKKNIHQTNGHDVEVYKDGYRIIIESIILTIDAFDKNADIPITSFYNVDVYHNPGTDPIYTKEFIPITEIKSHIERFMKLRSFL
jgi:hypothetical protein